MKGDFSVPDTKAPTYSRKTTALEENFLGVKLDCVLSLLPGLVAACLLAWLCIFLAKYVGTKLMGFDKSPISPVMLSIMLGLIVGGLVPVPAVLGPGFAFVVKKVLRFGIILLGIRLTIFDVFRLGVRGVPIVLVCVMGALLLTSWLNRRLHLPDRLGALIAVGTSICGVSAIVATGPAIDAEDKETAYAVAVITTFGLVATLLYPYIAHNVFGNAVQVGLFLGTSVHDTSQVVGAAKVYADVFSAPAALDIATVTKLVRNVCMVAVIPIMAFYYRRRPRGEILEKRPNVLHLFPRFVFGFLLMAAIRSIGDAGINAGGNAFGVWDAATWTSISSTTTVWAETLLVVALAGVGLSTDLRSFRGMGIKPFIVGLGAAVAVGALSFVVISLLGGFVSI
jgi:uncharacterized integral membrane protein (TIGR00698 family)